MWSTSILQIEWNKTENPLPLWPHDSLLWVLFCTLNCSCLLLMLWSSHESHYNAYTIVDSFEASCIIIVVLFLGKHLQYRRLGYFRVKKVMWNKYSRRFNFINLWSIRNFWILNLLELNCWCTSLNVNPAFVVITYIKK